MDEFLNEVSQFTPQDAAGYMSNQPDVLLGSYRDQSCQLLADTWLTLHKNAKAWIKAPLGNIQNEDRALFDAATMNSLSALQNIDASVWEALCIGTGVTVYGAVALSWCEGADIQDVWNGWETSGFPLKPLPEYERPARFLNPALMPKTRSLKGIVDAVGNSSLAICAAIASSPEPLEFDLDPKVMQSAKPQLAAFLKSRMLQKQGRRPEEDQLIAAWSATIKGTEFDIWEGV